jgi:hypothetical protein
MKNYKKIVGGGFWDEEQEYIDNYIQKNMGMSLDEAYKRQKDLREKMERAEDAYDEATQKAQDEAYHTAYAKAREIHLVGVTVDDAVAAGEAAERAAKDAADAARKNLPEIKNYNEFKELFDKTRKDGAWWYNVHYYTGRRPTTALISAWNTGAYASDIAGRGAEAAWRGAKPIRDVYSAYLDGLEFYGSLYGNVASHMARRTACAVGDTVCAAAKAAGENMGAAAEAAMMEVDSGRERADTALSNAAAAVGDAAVRGAAVVAAPVVPGGGTKTKKYKTKRHKSKKNNKKHKGKRHTKRPKGKKYIKKHKTKRYRAKK